MRDVCLQWDSAFQVKFAEEETEKEQNASPQLLKEPARELLYVNHVKQQNTVNKSCLPLLCSAEQQCSLLRGVHTAMKKSWQLKHANNSKLH